jgi:DNA-binding transcriptional MerR regulator
MCVNTDRLSIEELADAAGLTRRGVRFYVQSGLLPAPLGVGRGRHYDGSHLERLRRIRELQAQGHSLEEIRQIVEGKGVPLDTEVTRPRSVRPVLRAELWRKLRVMEGVEVSFDAGRFDPTVEELLAVREAIENVFAKEKSEARSQKPE